MATKEDTRPRSKCCNEIIEIIMIMPAKGKKYFIRKCKGCGILIN